MDNLQIPHGVQIAFDVNDIRVVESATKMEDAVDGADVGEESVAEALALCSAFDKTGDVDDGEVGGDFGGGFVEVAEPIKTGVGDCYAGFGGVNCTEGEVLEGILSAGFFSDDSRRCK